MLFRYAFLCLESTMFKLHVLQFIKARSTEVTEPIIRAATAGMKEAESSNLSVLNNLFAPMTRKRVKELGLGEKDEAKYVARLSREIDSSNNPGNVATGDSFTS